ncbi:hypothetical protein GETHLI_35800 [Geothrix limicola]|uniref:Uncharacterized protein n=1 Tax=Geothrix limicola TaxID=2927978 RepID=A0ABQ5QKH5_9BACT|nr:hypothetical protein GETHLI_35800 [Geothrix limicola]
MKKLPIFTRPNEFGSQATKRSFVHFIQAEHLPGSSDLILYLLNVLGNGYT